MTASRLLTLTAAAGAIACAGPALAHPESGPGHRTTDPEGAIVYHSDPVVQPLSPPPPPLPPPPSPPPPPPPPSEDFEYETHAVTRAAPMHGHPAPMSSGYHAGGAPHGMGYSYSAPHLAAHYPPPPRFDREAWLADCRDRIRGVDRRDRGGVIGGLLGAAAGGVIGNRAWDSERLAGTLLGAGVGGLAGIAIGAAIGAAGDRRREDECAWHLDRYMAAGQPGPHYANGYGYGYPAFTYVPVLVQIPQRAVVREYVTEEWVDVPQHTRPVTQTKIIRHPAPRADKRSKLIKAR